MDLTGIHHLTAITADAPRNYKFYTQTLGMRLVKKSVNQDDVSSYHLFYADGLATPGSDLTFFDWPAAPERRGTNSIVRTGLRVRDEASLRWWVQRFERLNVKALPIAERGGRLTLDFEDFEGQRLSLVVDDVGGAASPWERSPVPAQHQINGLGPIRLSVRKFEATQAILSGALNMVEGGTYTDFTGVGEKEVPIHVFKMKGEGAAVELHVAVEPNATPASQGSGAVHHVAFRTPDIAEYLGWEKRLAELGLPSSGQVDRYYFRSLYFREPNGILIEIATDGPGFAVDEPLATLGERLALPPFLEARRTSIQAGLKPLVTELPA